MWMNVFSVFISYSNGAARFKLMQNIKKYFVIYEVCQLSSLQ